MTNRLQKQDIVFHDFLSQSADQRDKSRLVHALDNLTLGVCGTEAPTTHTLLHSQDKTPKHRGIRRKIKQHSTDAMAS